MTRPPLAMAAATGDFFTVCWKTDMSGHPPENRAVRDETDAFSMPNPDRRHLAGSTDSPDHGHRRILTAEPGASL